LEKDYWRIFGLPATPSLSIPHSSFPRSILKKPATQREQRQVLPLERNSPAVNCHRSHFATDTARVKKARHLMFHYKLASNFASICFFLSAEYFYSWPIGMHC